MFFQLFVLFFMCIHLVHSLGILQEVKRVHTVCPQGGAALAGTFTLHYLTRWELFM